MKNLVLGFVLCSGLAHAETSSLSIKNFNFNYKAPQGSGSADAFSYNRDRDEKVQVEVQKIDTKFHLSASGAVTQEVELEAPGFMTEAETIDVIGFNLNLSQGFELSLTKGNFLSPESTVKLDNLSLSCQRLTSQPKLRDQLITGCLQKMTLKSDKFSSSEAERGLGEILSEALATVSRGSVGINSLNLRVTNGKFDLSADVKAQISGKARGNGTISFDSTTEVITMKISEVKFSILNVTGKVFDELKKQESDQLKVKEPYVYYSLKK